MLARETRVPAVTRLLCAIIWISWIVLTRILHES